jgi:hypothetical protein
MSLNCVSAYYNIPNKHGNTYTEEWFKITLAINCPYVFFTNKESIEIIRKYREGYPTVFIELNIEEFYTYKYKNRITPHPIHSPSVELNLIWNEKIFMIYYASQINPFNSEWFKWIDAGLCTYLYQKPPQCVFPNERKLDDLPKDKFIFSSSDSDVFEKEQVNDTNYYHYVSGTYLLHKNFINAYSVIYKIYMDKLINEKNIWTDQVIHTHIYKDYPKLFFKLGDGYAVITKYLFE